jgi:hypothetical protein
MVDLRQPAANRRISASSLGRAIALDLAGRGYLIQATDIDADAAAATAAEIVPVRAPRSSTSSTRRPATRSRRRRNEGRNARSLGQQRRRAGHRPVVGARRGNDLRRSGVSGVQLSAVCPDGIWTPMLEDKLDDPRLPAPFPDSYSPPERSQPRSAS